MLFRDSSTRLASRGGITSTESLSRKACHCFATAASHRGCSDSGILLQSESDFPTAVIFDDLEALALRVTEQGKAVLMNITRNDAPTNAQLANISISAPNMSYTFYSAAKFNNMIENWDVSNVINMACMFYLGRISVNTREELLKFLM